MRQVQVNFRCSEGLLAALESARELAGVSRNAWLRAAAVEKLTRDRLEGPPAPRANSGRRVVRLVDGPPPAPPIPGQLEVDDVLGRSSGLVV